MLKNALKMPFFGAFGAGGVCVVGKGGSGAEPSIVRGGGWVLSSRGGGAPQKTHMPSSPIYGVLLCYGHE